MRRGVIFITILKRGYHEEQNLHSAPRDEGASDNDSIIIIKRRREKVETQTRRIK